MSFGDLRLLFRHRLASPAANYDCVLLCGQASMSKAKAAAAAAAAAAASAMSIPEQQKLASKEAALFKQVLVRPILHT
jgi:hypothetical protein